MKKLFILIFSLMTVMLFTTSCDENDSIVMDIDTNNKIFTTDMSEEELKERIHLTRIDEDGNTKEIKNFDLIFGFSEGLCEVVVEYKDSLHSKKVFFVEKNKLSYEGDFVFYEYNDKDYLLQYNGNATELVLPVRNKKYIIFDEVFAYNSALQSVDISDSVIGIGKDAFLECKSLKRVHFGNSVKFVCTSAFTSCTALEYVGTDSLDAWCGIKFDHHDVLGNFDSSTTTNIGEVYFVFAEMPGVMIDIESGEIVEVERPIVASNPLEIAKSLYVNGKHITDVVIPESVTKIHTGAFFGSDIKSVTIHSNVQSIGNYAFGNCENLEKIEINALNEDIAASVRLAFGTSCPAINEYNGGRYIGNAENPYAFFIQQKDTTCTKTDIHEKTEAICSHAFENAENIKEIHLPDSVEFIAPRALTAPNVTKITFGKSVRYIGACPVANERVFKIFFEAIPEKANWYYVNKFDDKVSIDHQTAYEYFEKYEFSNDLNGQDRWKYREYMEEMKNKEFFLNELYNNELFRETSE